MSCRSILLLACVAMAAGVAVAQAPSPPGRAQVSSPAPVPDGRRREALVAQARSLLEDHGDDIAAIERAHGLLLEVQKTDPRNSPAHVEMARYFLMLAWQKGGTDDQYDMNHAEGELALAERLDPRNADAYELMGSTKRAEARYVEALKDLRTAQDLGMTNPWLYINLAKTYVGMGRWTEAAQTLHALERQPGRPQWPAGVESGLTEQWLAVHRHAGDMAAIGRDFATLHMRNPDMGDLRDDHALFLLGGQNDPDAAIAEADRILAHHPDDWRAPRVRALARMVKWDQLRIRDPQGALRFRATTEAAMPYRAGFLTTGAPWLGRSARLQHLVLALHSEGLSLDAKDVTGSTALLCAIHCATPISVGWLLDHGANPDVADNEGTSPLVWAVIRYDMASFDMLLAHQADVNAISGHLHETALFTAVDNDEVEMVRKLLAHGAKVNIAASSNRTPLMMAASDGSKSMVQMLLAAGADASQIMENGQDAAQQADYNHHPDIATLIRNHRK